MKNLILASASPRRKELLEQIGLTFTVIPSHADEVITKTLPGEIVEELSRQKAEDIAKDIEEGIIIGSDTIVWQDGHVMGKPHSREEAWEMLRRIQGSTHSGFTGVAVLVKESTKKDNADGSDEESAEQNIKEENDVKNAEENMKCHTFFCETKVHVYPMTEAETEGYLRAGEVMDRADGRVWDTDNGHQPEWYDKAGAYGIQGRFGAWVKGIEGDYNSVVGLPVSALWQVLKNYL